MWFCSESRDPGFGTRGSAGNRGRDRGPGTGGPSKAVPAVVFVGWADSRLRRGEAQHNRPGTLGFTRMKSGFSPTYIGARSNAQRIGPMMLGFRRTSGVSPIHALRGSRVPGAGSRLSRLHRSGLRNSESRFVREAVAP